MTAGAKRVLGIAALILALPLVIWIVYNLGFWFGEAGTRTAP